MLVTSTLHRFSANLPTEVPQTKEGPPKNAHTFETRITPYHSFLRDAHHSSSSSRITLRHRHLDRGTEPLVAVRGIHLSNRRQVLAPRLDRRRRPKNSVPSAPTPLDQKSPTGRAQVTTVTPPWDR